MNESEGFAQLAKVELPTHGGRDRGCRMRCTGCTGNMTVRHCMVEQARLQEDGAAMIRREPQFMLTSTVAR
jgi:hypothetical protein